MYRLEQEIQRYRDRLSDAEYYKTRVSELREDNKALMETRDALEEQLQRARKRAEQCLTLEAAMIKLKREANDIALVSNSLFSTLFLFILNRILYTSRLHSLKNPRVYCKTGDPCYFTPSKLLDALKYSEFHFTATFLYLKVT